MQEGWQQGSRRKSDVKSVDTDGSWTDSITSEAPRLLSRFLPILRLASRCHQAESWDRPGLTNTGNHCTKFPPPQQAISKSPSPLSLC